MPDDQQPKPMSQNEIDALFNELGNDVPKPAAEEPAPAPSGPLSQDAIDALLNEAGAAAPAAEAQPEPEPAAAPEPAGGPLSQDAIDALLNEAGAAAPAEPEPAPTPEPEPTGGPLSQDAIDALLNQAADPAPEAPPAAPEPTPEPEPAGGPLSQDAIDALLNQAGVGDEGIGAETTPEDEGTEAGGNDALDQQQVDALLSEVAAEIGAPLTDSVPAEGPLNQDTIDGLLAQLGDGGDTNSEANDEMAEPRTGSLSMDDIESLMTKHAGDGPETSGHSTEMIDQGDIDALVAQLGDATEEPALDEQETIVDRDVDQMLAQAEANVTAADAIAPSMAAPTHAAMSMPGGAAMVPAGALMSTEEMRGTRFLLVTAVVMLMACTVILALVVSSVNGLTDELRKGREAELVPTDDFTDDIGHAETYLTSDDVAEQVRGVEFMDRLKEQYQNNPDRLAAISWRLARHYRVTEQYARAVEEYALIHRRAAGLVDNPVFYIEYSESLQAVERLHDAQLIAYRLVANDQWYLADDDPSGIPRDPEQLARNHAAVRRAKLLLGELYLALANQPGANRSGGEG